MGIEFLFLSGMYNCVTERDVILLVAEEIYGKASQPLNSGLFKKCLFRNNMLIIDEFV